METQHKLTYKQQRFIEHYTTNGGNATKAARDAGYKGNEYSLRVIGCQNLTKLNVKTAIDAITQRKQESNEAKIQRILNKLESIAYDAQARKSDALKAMELLGKYHAIWSEKRIIENIDRQRELDEQEQAEAKRIALLRFKTA